MSYGCYNRQPFKEFLKVQSGWLGGKRIETTIDFRMARDCQYTKTELGRKDERCIGCKWRMPDAPA